MSLRHAILGFLTYQPMTGYELKRAFDGSVRHFWPADQSQIYRTLKQLHNETLIEMETIPREEQLDVKVYSVTDEGLGELRQWLATPLPEQDNREPFLVQLYFAFLLPDADALHLVEAKIAETETTLATLEAVYGLATDTELEADVQRPFFYSMLTLDYGLRANTWYRDWLLDVRRRIVDGTYAVSSLDELMARDDQDR